MKIRTIAASLLVFLHGGCLFAGAAEAGGGTVLVPAGTYLRGSIKPQITDGVPAAAFAANVTGLTISNSRALEPSGK